MIEIIIIAVMLLVSLALIVKGADYLIDGAADVARWLNISPLLVGLTLVAFGTSLPEFIVSIFSSIAGKGDLAVGNIIGSNVANIGLILGISAIVIPLTIKSKTLIYEFPFLMISSFLVLILGVDLFIYQQGSFGFQRLDGIIFLVMFLLFLTYIYRSLREEQKTVQQEFKTAYPQQNPHWKNALFILGGLAGLVVGGKMFIVYATKLAVLTGIADSFIGLIIAAVGTSLPELASSIAAAWKKQGDIAVGNVIGSNIFNILFVLGAASLIKPIAFTSTLVTLDGVVMLAITTLFLIFATKGKNTLRRTEGIMLVLSYLLYVGYLATTI